MREAWQQQYLPNLLPDQPPLRELIPGFFIASSPMQRLAEEIERVAAVDATVLIFGETGAGKELTAKAIHERSKRTHQPFTVIDCARLTPELAESELFGHERGAFTSADRAKKGLFAAADGGTVFLDEVAELPPAAQAKLLRVLETLELRSVGGTAYHPIKAGVIVATNQDLAKLVWAGRFRQDLFYRLDVLRLRVPPLRERQEDIRALVMHFLGAGAPEKQFSPEAMGMLEAYSWPGNVRELKNFVVRVGAANSSRIVGKAEVAELLLPAGASDQPESHAAAEMPVRAASRDGLGKLTGKEMKRQCLEVKRQYLVELGTKCQWNRTQMARASGVSYRTILNWIKECGLYRISRPGKVNFPRRIFYGTLMQTDAK